MIDNFVKVSLKNPTSDASIKRTTITRKSFTLKYPCTNTSKCVPYVLELSPGSYKFECWGSKGGGWWAGTDIKSKPGLGAYTSGTIFLSKSTTFYIYIGTTGLFNAVNKNIEETESSYGVPGAATDVRLNYSNEWFNTQSLLSRIMVAAGGGGAEWAGSIGGNGGEIEGGESTSSKDPDSYEAHEDKCAGATQTSGSTCPSYQWGSSPEYNAAPGTFGISGIPDLSNCESYGGIGGSGYYGGTSYDYAYAGSGGSSFVSGHKQCNAVKDSETIQHSGDSVHYSGYVFNDPLMIRGNTTMPDPNDPTHEGKYSGTGAFRITLIHYQYHCTYTKSFFRHSIYLFLFIAK